MKDRIIDNILGIVACKLCYQALMTLADIGATQQAIIDLTAKVALPRIESIHNTYLRDPCYVEMTTDERIHQLKPYVDVIVQAALVGVSKLHHNQCMEAINQAFTQLVINRKSK